MQTQLYIANPKPCLLILLGLQQLNLI